MVYYDLTLPIQDAMPVYPGDEPVALRRLGSLPDDLFQTTSLHMGSHTGTHVDVPRHCQVQGASLADLPLASFCGLACVISLPWQPGQVLDLAQADWSNWQAGDALLVSTGWEDRAGTPKFYENSPIFAAGTAEWLVAAGIRLLGVDLPTVQAETTGSGDWSAMHTILLGAGVIIVEGLINLRPLAGRRLEFFAMPLLIPGGDGSPVRAFARD
jgi:arylformamidase